MFKPQYKQLISVHGIKLKPSDVHKSQPIAITLSLVFSAITSIPQLLKCDTDMVASYCVVPYLQRYYALVNTSNAVHDYCKRYRNVVTQMCSGFY